MGGFTRNTTPETTGIGLSLPNGRRGELITSFRAKYNTRLPIEYKPSGASLKISTRAHARKSAEFTPLSKIGNLIDGRYFHSEPANLSKNLTTDLAGGTKRNTSDFNTSAESFLRAARVLMGGYALVSAFDVIPWCALEAAQKHIITVGNISRTSSKHRHTARSRILDAEMPARREWARIAQSDTRYTLTDIIEIVSQRHSIFPIANGLKGVRNWKGGVSKHAPYGSPPNGNDRANSWQNKGCGESSKCGEVAKLGSQY